MLEIAIMRRIGRLGLLLVCASVGACGSSGDTGEHAQSSSSALTRAFSRLERENASSWTLSSDTEVHTAEGFGLSVQRIEGHSQRLLVDGITARDATLAFFTRFRAQYRMREPASEFSLVREERDALGMTHVRLQQVERGVPVKGAEAIAHYDDGGALRVIDMSYLPRLAALDLSPALSPEQALAAAQADLTSITRSEPALDTRIERAPALVIHARDGVAPALAYHLVLRTDAPHRMDYLVDAHSGEIRARFDDIETVDGSGTGVNGDTKTLHISQSGNTYSLTDDTRAASIQTYTLKNATSGLPGTLETSTSTTRWDTADPGAGAAVDAHYFAGVVYDYYKSAHGRAGIDGQNGAIISSVHYSSGLVNAFWDGQQMAYGDGDGGETARALSAALDVVGHELTHGVTQNTSALTYQGQTGALNESMSDIMGSVIEHSVKPDPVNNWLIGEAISPSHKPFRDFIHPANGEQPAHMSKYVNTQQDNGGVHINSGIPNNAFFLMTAAAPTTCPR